MPTFRAFLINFEQTIVGAYRGKRWLWHVLAGFLTAVLVFSGADWGYFLATRSISHVGLGAAILGFFTPILLPVILYIVGEIRHREPLKAAGIAVAQAAAAGWLVSSFYKIFTGRMQPEFYTFTSAHDTSRDFLFGLFRHGIFWGWPSSHVAVAFASMIALLLMLPRSRALRYVVIAYLLYAFIGISVSIHWLSDALAGAIIGTVIAYAATDRFRTTP